jgi:plastocyanin
MDNATTFYVLGAVLAVSAVIVSFLGLRVERFPGRAAPLVFLCFAILVGAATTFAVRNGKEEQEAKASELTEASEEAEEEEASPVETPSGKGQAGGGGETQEPAGGKGGEKEIPPGGAEGSGGTLQLAADPSDIAFDTTTLSSKPGKVTIEFDNPAALEHNVAIERDGKQLATSPTIAEGKTSVTADLEPGDYTFLCTVPGHAEAGMEGTLTIK